MGDLVNHKVILVALVGGIFPALFWLWFWLKEDKERPEPRGLIFLTFLLGMATVIFVLPFQQLARTHLDNQMFLTLVWATMEEVIKYGAVALVAFKSAYVDEPIDYPIYMIAAALGFAALENTLFLIHPLSVNDTTVGLLTGNLRFLGATLLHAVASAMVGISMGLAFYGTWFQKKFYLFGGILTAIALHALFNFFIMKNDGQNFFSVFGFLWIVTIICILLFEKLRRMSEALTHVNVEPIEPLPN
ncbi:MAG: PrsW family intramembrane metalloprotease [Candidatus Pacebacteria bacterium]|nr:PrsW family intramembrane metalloprotease [Candidatus Paceibacterota bacterium]MBP9780493.1 PrsW family intramembrane metalloprotease [Candidatus Paceibacterota bacterium]